jgi:hypothetical protein
MLKSRNNKVCSVGDNDEESLLPAMSQLTKMISSQETSITIPIELLPATTQIDERRLFEITDSTVVARISQMIPAVAQTAANTAAKSIAKKTLSNPNLYLVKIPFGTTLVNPTKKGVQYATYRGAKKGLAEVVKPDLSKMTKSTSLANGVANVMKIGSFVVGQYYMSEISAKLENMTKSIDKIGDFQDRKFKSRILSVITLVGEISQFSSEIMENDNQRNLKLIALDNLKATSIELLGQVNITISEITQRTTKLDYKDYQSIVDDFKKLVSYQNAMVTALEEISKLTYLLGKGFISIEQSYSSFNKYLELSVQTRNLLGQWHDRQVKALNIDLDKERISKSGFKAVVSAIPGLFDDKYKYNELSQNLVNEISTQAKTILKNSYKPKQVYDDDVEIIVKGGKYYYLHELSPNSQETSE